jgi:hypothetical protein
MRLRRKAFFCCGLKRPWGLGFSSRQVVRAGVDAAWKDQENLAARQVTIFAILATRDAAMVDQRLAGVETQLRKALPNHGFRLLGVESKRIAAGQSVTCELGNGYRAETVLVRSLDENGKVQIRCLLAFKGEIQFSTLVKTPVNQLFFCDHSLKDGSRVLIGVGAR